MKLLKHRPNNSKMRTTEYGLLDEWRKRNQPFPEQCMTGSGKANTDTGKKSPKMITLQNLMGPFAILLIGYVAALTAFIIEAICFRVSSNRVNK